MSCAICYDDFTEAGREFVIGCNVHPFHAECYFEWNKSLRQNRYHSFRPSRNRVSRECFICKIELPVSDLLKVLRATDDSSLCFFEACASDDLELLEKKLYSRQELFERDYLELVKVALDQGSLKVAQFLKTKEKDQLMSCERKELVLKYYRRPSAAKYCWILNNFDSPIDPKEGIRSAETVAEFNKASAHWELFHIYNAEFANLDEKQQIDILVILYDAHQSGLMNYSRFDFSMRRELPDFLGLIIRDNPNHSCHILTRVIPFLVMTRVKDWESMTRLCYVNLVWHCEQCNSSRHLDDAVMIAIQNNHEPFFKMMVQQRRLPENETKLVLEDVARAIQSFCKEPLKFKRIFEVWHPFGSGEAKTRWDSYFDPKPQHPLHSD